MLFPKKVKFIKVKKFKLFGIQTKDTTIGVGLYGVKCLSLGRVTASQIESVRKAISRKMNKVGILRFFIFPFLPVSCKPIEVRMGKGKGSLSYWCFPVKPGRILFEFSSSSSFFAVSIYKLVRNKLPVYTKLVFSYGC